MIYACMGMYLFGGKINTNEMNRLVDKYPEFEYEEDWLYLNFNDYVMALNTLFGIMWQNDWEGIVFMYELIFDYEKDLAVLMYFISFIVLANLIFVNIIIAFIIDTYLSIDETLAAEKQAKAMKHDQPENNGTGQETHSLLAELNNNPAQFTSIMEILN